MPRGVKLAGYERRSAIEEKTEAMFFNALTLLGTVKSSYTYGGLRGGTKYFENPDFHLISVNLLTARWELQYGTYGDYFRFTGKGPTALRKRMLWVRSMMWADGKRRYTSDGRYEDTPSISVFFDRKPTCMKKNREAMLAEKTQKAA